MIRTTKTLTLAPPNGSRIGGLDNSYRLSNSMVSPHPFGLIYLCFSIKLVELFRNQMLAVDEEYLRVSGSFSF